MGLSSPSATVLCVAGSDPGAGAGLQMDERVALHCGRKFAGVVAVDTVQSEHGLHSASARSATEVGLQCRQILESSSVCAIKTGALGNEKIVRALARCFAEFPEIPLVVDPVRQASRVAVSGATLLTTQGWFAMQDLLFPLATLVTPNEQEWQQGKGYESCAAVLVTGLAGESNCVVDQLLRPEQAPKEWSHPRLAKHDEIHGTGCMLATAIACNQPAAARRNQPGQLKSSIRGQHAQVSGTMLDEAIGHALKVIADGAFR